MHFVTGGGSGIGLATTTEFARAGAKIAIAGDGKVSNVEVVEAEPKRVFDRAAVDALGALLPSVGRVGRRFAERDSADLPGRLPEGAELGEDRARGLRFDDGEEPDAEVPRTLGRLERDAGELVQHAKHRSRRPA